MSVLLAGWQVCADTLVGNQMVRGISGGQRKRVTTGELVVGPMKVLFMVRPYTLGHPPTHCPNARGLSKMMRTMLAIAGHRTPAAFFIGCGFCQASSLQRHTPRLRGFQGYHGKGF